MEKIQFDSGMQRFRINGDGVLTFNPADPNLYARLQNMGQRLMQMEQMLSAHEGQDTLTLMTLADGEMKKELNAVFPGNDFETLLSGVNLLAITGDGKTVLENFIDALTPILCDGAEKCAQHYANAAITQAQTRRGTQC